MRSRALLLSLLLGILGVVAVGAVSAESAGHASPRPGLLADPNVFPIGVWLQNPRHAARYRTAGFNLYIGLWKGPTATQLQQLQAARMAVICSQNALGLAHRDDPTIVGWMQQDEPDNAQSLGRGQGYGPPVAPAEVRQRYERMRAADPARPVLLNLGQGVAWDQWHGRGVRTNCPEDYPLYVQAGDIVSFDIYPACHAHPEVAGQLWYVARGVERLVGWTQGTKSVWNCIECTRINHPERKATPHQVRCEVWMSIVHGSTGLIYFVHEWQPRFNEAALLSDPEMLAAVTRLNHRIQTLAPVLHSPTIADGITVESMPTDVPIAVMMKRAGGVTYVFAVALRGAATQAKFTVAGLTGAVQIDVLDEDRALTAHDGVFRDSFAAWDVHLYALSGSATR
jgi:hypothetical protein